MLSNLVLAAALASASPWHAEGDDSLRWIRTFSSPQEDWINDLVPLRDGRWLGVGFLGRDGSAGDWQALSFRVDGEGGLHGEHRHGVGSGVDAFWSVGENPDGSLLQVGFSNRIGAGGLDAWLLHADHNGRQLTETTIGEADYDRVTDLAATADGWLVAGHSVLPGSGRRRVLLAGVDASGRERWRRILQEGDSSGALYVAATPDGGYVVSGGSSRGEDADLLLLKIDAEGRERWRRRFGAVGTSDTNHGVVVRPDGRIVAVGYTQSWGAKENDVFAVTLGADGEVERLSLLGSEGDDRVIGAQLDGTGRVWVTGYTRSTQGDWDIFVAATDTRGCFASGAAILSAKGDDQGTVVQPLPDGDLLLAGYSNSFGRGDADAFLMRIAAPRMDDAHMHVRGECGWPPDATHPMAEKVGTAGGKD